MQRVLNSIRTFNDIYIHQKSPFDVYLKYVSFEIYLKGVSEDYVPDVIDYKDIKTRYDNLEIKFANLKAQYEILVTDNAKQRHQIDERFMPLIEECSSFTEKQLGRLIQTRIIPFKLMNKATI